MGGGESTAPCRAAGSVGAKRGLERCNEIGGPPGDGWLLGGLEGARWGCERRILLPASGRRGGWRRDGAVNVERQGGHDFSTAPGDSAL